VRASRSFLWVSMAMRQSIGGYGDGVRHNFVNDIGDYAKYALLRALCDADPAYVRLGVIWYLTDHEESNGDGRKRAHLSGSGWETLDPGLLAAMRDIEWRLQGKDQLNVRLIEAASILPGGTAFFAEALPRAGGSAQTRVAERVAWFERARKAVTDRNLVFIDPDNGLQPRSVRLTSPLAGKYATAPEIAALLDAGTAVVLYQHGSRMAWPEQRENVCSAVVAATGKAVTIRTLRFRAYGVRAFFCITTNPRMTGVVNGGMDLLRRRTEGWDKARYLVME
jgi:hypothetical protein